MSRAKKLLVVSLVLVLGIGLAWPFRSVAPEFAPTEPSDAPVMPIREAVPRQTRPAPLPEQSASVTPTAERHVAAKMASTGDEAGVAPAPVGLDVENHPALANHPLDGPRTRPVPDRPAELVRDARPAYAISSPAPAEESAWPEEVVHIVRNGDTLEKLAQRYLGDEGRALELFDLNREQLANPHLLPIGAELRIPVPPQREVD
jgi:nucleoid-associated protein YgaU